MSGHLLRRSIEALDPVIGRAWHEAESDQATEFARAAGWRRCWLRAQYGLGFARMAVMALCRHEASGGIRPYLDAMRESRPVLVGASARFMVFALAMLAVESWRGRIAGVLPGSAVGIAWMLPLIWFAALTPLSATRAGDAWRRLPFARRARTGVALAVLTFWCHALILPTLATLTSWATVPPPSIRPAFARTVAENTWLLATMVRDQRFDLASVVVSDMVGSLTPALALAVAVGIPLVARRYVDRGAAVLSRVIALMLLLPLFLLQMQAFPAPHRLSGDVLLSLSLVVTVCAVGIGVHGAVLAFRYGTDDATAAGGRA